MLRLLVLFVCVSVLVSACVAENAAYDPDIRVRGILALIMPNDPLALARAEEELVQEGEPLLPAMQRQLAGNRRQIELLRALLAVADMSDEVGQQIAAGLEQLTRETVVLDQAIFRVANNINPRKLIVAWAHGLRHRDGRAFTREFTPQPLGDPEAGRMARAFPDYRFYFVHLPGYQGGAAPPEELLRQLEVPEPLQRVNVFAVAKTGRVTLITRAEPDLRNLFFASLSPGAGEADAVDAWLRLSTVFHWRLYEPVCFIIQPAVVTAVAGGGETARGAAQVSAEQGRGQLEVTMTFDTNGRLVALAETANLDIKPEEHLIPMAPPRGRVGEVMPE